MPFAAHPPMQLSRTNYLSALLARLSAKLAIAIAIAIATSQKLRFTLAPIKTLAMVISQAFTRTLKQSLARYMTFTLLKL